MVKIMELLFLFWMLFAYFMSLTLLTRHIMARNFISADISNNTTYKNALQRMTMLGTRFDAKVVTGLLTVPFLLLVIRFIFPQFITEITTGLSTYLFICGLLFLGILFGNYFYFKTYNTHYDVFIFGLVEEDTKAVLKNMWDDYPVLRFLLSIGTLAFLPAYFSYNYLLLLEPISFRGMSLSLFIVSLIAIILLLRGTINSKPLGRIHAQVSSVGVINKLVPNGILAMQWAFKDKKREVAFTPVEKAAGQELMQKSLGVDWLHHRTAKNDYLATHKPNVIFTVMESFGMNGLVLDNEKTNDLLGNLRPFMNSEFVFKRFLSSSDGTMNSLTHLYFHSYLQHLSQSVVQNTAIKETPFQVYKSQGYKTIFITAGNAMWRNLANYLPLQGVDELYDQNDIMDRYPDAKKTLSYWGIADEFAFKLAEDLLTENDQPVFINILTITNHPPYQVPSTYKGKNIDPSVLRDKFGNNDTERKNSLTTYQYACNELGNFIARIKQHTKGNNTVIAATGDHHIRSVRQELPKELFLAHCVPFILSAPEAIKAQLDIHYQPNKLGSHKDIFPTLYAMTLSETTYWSAGGENLLTEANDNTFAINGCVWADSYGFVDLTSPTLTKYHWEDSDNAFLSNGQEIHEHNKEKINAYIALLDWQINFLTKGFKS